MIPETHIFSSWHRMIFSFFSIGAAAQGTRGHRILCISMVQCQVLQPAFGLAEASPDAILANSYTNYKCSLIYIILYYITLHYIILHYTTLHYITLHYILLYYITLYYITLRYIILYYIILHYITSYYLISH